MEDNMEHDSMRQALLMELIDSMHGRLADKMFPPDPSKDDQPAVSGIVGPEHEAMGQDIPMVNPPAVEDEKSIDVDHDADEPTDEELVNHDADEPTDEELVNHDADEPTDEELDELLK